MTESVFLFVCEGYVSHVQSLVEWKCVYTIVIYFVEIMETGDVAIHPCSKQTDSQLVSSDIELAT